MSTFFVPSFREPVTYIDKTGKTAFTRPWFLFFQGLFDRVGGAIGPGTEDLATSLERGAPDSQLSAQIYALTDELRGTPPQRPLTEVDLVMGELNDVRAELAELRKTVEGIQQGTTL